VFEDIARKRIEYVTFAITGEPTMKWFSRGYSRPGNICVTW
jgi:hypothetical protein